MTGASSGIGAELARELVRRGLGVTLVARRADRLHQLATELASHGVARVEVLPADLSDPEGRAALPAAIAGLGLTVDVLVNNAGFSTSGPVHRADRARELELVRTDVEAVVDLCTLFVAGMTSRRQGAVLNVASTAAYLPLPRQASYGAAKAFVLSYTHALRAEVAPAGVTVTALCPGPVDTEFAAVAGLGGDHVVDKLPRFLFVSPAAVAHAGIEGLADGRAAVIPGALNRAGAVASALAPPSLVARILGATRHDGDR